MLKWLVELRGDRSQYELSKEIGIPQTTYARIEVGSRNPSINMAKKIAGHMWFEWTKIYETNEQDEKIISLKKYRLKNNMTQVQLAERSGVSQASIVENENGKLTNPTLSATKSSTLGGGLLFV